MKHKITYLLLIAVVGIFIGACSGGGGDSRQDPDANDAQSGDRILSGVAAKGLLKYGLVRVYAIDNFGFKGEKITEGMTDIEGRFQLNLSGYEGAVLIEGSGSYIDEATGLEETIPENMPLRAALPTLVADQAVAVTPVTELAVRRAEMLSGGLRPDDVEAANDLLGQLFKFDILRALPVSPTALALAGATDSQKSSTLALAALCQLAANENLSVTQLLDRLTAELDEKNHFSSETLVVFDKAVDDFLVGDFNQTGISNSNSTSLPTVGRVLARLEFKIQSEVETDGVGGVGVTIRVPGDVLLKINEQGEVNDESFRLAPGITQGIASTRYVTTGNGEDGHLSLAVISPAGLGQGMFAT
ncbi:hypothetical protein ACHHRT_13810, partial [Desulfurivibrio sp. D14AmB]|uniref:hypothetical protein n=1 Tax=Desulfurivibrio sp. D14AmB TaxID=3374370 RepID=UPI00376F231B